MGQRYTWEGVGRRKVWFRKGEKRQAGHTGVELTFVFSRGSGLRAHGAAHKHPMAPVEGLIYQGDSWDTSARGQRQPLSLYDHRIPSGDLDSFSLLGPQPPIFKPHASHSTSILHSPGGCSRGR